MIVESAGSSKSSSTLGLRNSASSERVPAGVPNLYRQSVFIEFRDGDQIVESLMLPLPPQSIKVTQPMKKNVSQTGYGAFLNHYGLGLGTISLNGHTGGYGELRKTIGGPNHATEGPWDSGKSAQEILHRIARYPNADKTKANFERLECRIYDLTIYQHQTAFQQHKDSKSISNPLGYVVSIDNFSMDRSTDKYGYYYYTLNATILGYLGEYRQHEFQDPLPLPPSLKAFWQFIGKVQEATAKIHNIRGKVVGALATANSYVNAVQSITQLVESVRAWGRIPAQVQGLLNNAIDTTYDVAASPARLAKDAYQTSKDIYNRSAALLEKVQKDFGEKLKGEYESVYREIEADIASNASYWKQINAAATAMAAQRKTKKAQSNAVATAPSRFATDSPSNQGSKESGQTPRAYGYRLVVKSADMSLDKLAQKYLGDYRQGAVILAANNTGDWDAVAAGTEIKIPLTKPQEQDQNNRIFSENPADILGVDIAHDEEGELMFTDDGNLQRVSGTENLIQAVRHRLDTKLGAEVRKAGYGILLQAGEALGSEQAQSYVSTSILDTLAQEPRIKEVQELQYDIEGDSVVIQVAFESVLGETAFVYRAA